MYFLLLVCYITSAAMDDVTSSSSTLHSQGVQQSSEKHTVVTSVEVHTTQMETTDTKVSVHQSSESHDVVVTSQSVNKTQDIDPKVSGFVKDHSTHSKEHHSTQSHSNGTSMKDLPTSLGKVHPLVTSKSISIPDVNIILQDNTLQIWCICKIGPDVIEYKLILGDQVVKQMTVTGKEAAFFQINITSAMSSDLYCRARTLSGEEETSQLMRIDGGTQESEDKAGDKTKSEKEEKDAEPKFLISLTHILTSVSQPVQDVNKIIISVCGSVLLTLPLIVLGVHFYKQREQKVEPTLSFSA